MFRQSRDEYDKAIGTDDPGLSAFPDAGGKLLTYPGQADQLIPTQGTVDYRERVERKLGGAHRVDGFYRLFLAPGTAHCALRGQVDDRAALTKWVEQGRAPETLTASGRTLTRDLCRYPLVSHHKGQGDPADADSFRCVPPQRH